MPAHAQWDADDVVLRQTQVATGSGIGYVIFSDQVTTVASTTVSGSTSSSGQQTRDFGRFYFRSGSPPDLLVAVDGNAYAYSRAFGSFPIGWAKGHSEAAVVSLSIGSSVAQAVAIAESTGSQVEDFGTGVMPVTS
jgi:hypothetical protein